MLLCVRTVNLKGNFKVEFQRRVKISASIFPIMSSMKSKQSMHSGFVPSLSVKLLLLTDRSSGVEVPLVLGLPTFLCVKCSRLMLPLFCESFVKFRKT